MGVRGKGGLERRGGTNLVTLIHSDNHVVELQTLIDAFVIEMIAVPDSLFCRNNWINELNL